MAPTQKALFLDAKFAPYVLKERPIPKPGKGQLLVRNEAAALNPVDWKIQKLGWFVEDYPAIVGTDIAGVVEEVGEGVTNFQKGDRVFFQGAWSHDEGGYQQHVLTNAATTAKIPSNLSFDQAASIPVALACPVVGFYQVPPHGAGLKEPWVDGKGAYAGKPAVILGGGTSVGQYAIQLAKLSGFSPIITVASKKHEEWLKSLGATHIIDRSTPAADVQKEVEKITGGKQREFVLDAVANKDTQHLAHSLTSSGGKTVVVLPAEIEKAQDKELYHALGIFGFPHTRPLGERFYAAVSKLVEEGHIKPTRVEVVPGGLNGVVGGLERLEKDLVSGTKLVVHPQETA